MQEQLRKSRVATKFSLRFQDRLQAIDYFEISGPFSQIPEFDFVDLYVTVWCDSDTYTACPIVEPLNRAHLARMKRDVAL